MNWQIDVAEHIINGVHSDVLVQLPEEIGLRLYINKQHHI